MAIDQQFISKVVESMQQSGWQVAPFDTTYPNPVSLTFHRNTQEITALVYARETTPQQSSHSDHNRPAGEMHAQMIFDGDRRGAGERNYLQFYPGVYTVLFGFWPHEREYIIAAYDPDIHQDYSYSKSLQVKESTMRQAASLGMAFQRRRNGETIVAFPVSEIETYLLQLSSDEFNLHKTSPETLESLQTDISQSGRMILNSEESVQVPDLQPEDRRVVVREVSQKVRSANFTRGIREVYERCATCGFQYDYVLDAAHIIPVAEGGNDTYENGLGLCPTCHRMFDKGFILIDGNYTVHLNPRYIEDYKEIGRADSLDDLQQRLRKILWLPDNKIHHPSPENLSIIFKERR